jgi:hypothetical protein
MARKGDREASVDDLIDAIEANTRAQTALLAGLRELTAEFARLSASAPQVPAAGGGPIESAIGKGLEALFTTAPRRKRGRRGQ